MTQTPAALPRRPPLLNRRVVLLLAFAAALVWSLDRAGVLGSANGALVNAGGWELVRRFFAAGLRPDLSPDLLRLTLASAGATLAFAVCGTVLAVAFGLVGGLFASETWWRLGQGNLYGSTAGLSPGRRLWWLAGRGALALPRGLHEAVWGLLLLSVLGLDPLVAILAIAVPYGAITAKVYAEILDEMPRAALDALAGSGVAPFRALVYGLLPPAAPPLVSYGLYRLECALRSAAVLGLIGAGGLGYQILLSLQSLRYEQVWTFLYALIVLVAVTDGVSSLANRFLNVPRQTEVRQNKAGEEAKPPPLRAAFGQSRPLTGTLLSIIAFIAVAGLVGASFRYAGADVRKLTDERTIRLARQAARDLFPPQWDAPLLRDLAGLTLDTLAMSLIAIGGAALLGLIASLGAASNLVLPVGRGGLLRGVPRRAVGWLVLALTRGALLVARALSESVWALLVLFVLFPGILPGAPPSPCTTQACWAA